jgi:membrane protease YdiL (CAAX protease family)
VRVAPAVPTAAPPAGGSGGLRSEAPTRAPGRQAAPSVSPPVDRGAVVVAGLAFLLLRPGLEGLGPGTRSAVLAAGYLGLTAAAAPGRDRAGARRASPPLPAWVVLAAGLAAVLAMALLGGPAPPLPGGGLALLLGALAAVAEEALFRGALYAGIQRWAAPAALAIAGSAVAFALVHLPFYGPMAFPVDLGAGLLLGWQRWASDRWTVPAATHAVANLLAVILR